MGVRIISLYNQIFGKLLLVKYRNDLEINYSQFKQDKPQNKAYKYKAYEKKKHNYIS